MSPQCWERGSGGHSCGGALVRLPDKYEEADGERKNDKKANSSGPSRCRGRGCPNSPILICKVASHTRGLCQRCTFREMEQLLGPTGSTHVYNGNIGRVDGASGKLYICNFFSRKDQMDDNGEVCIC